MSIRQRETHPPGDAGGVDRRLVLSLLETARPATEAGLEGFLARATTAAARLGSARYAAVGITDVSPERRLAVVVHTRGGPDDVEVVDGPHVDRRLTGLLDGGPRRAVGPAARADLGRFPGDPGADSVLLAPITVDGVPAGVLCLAGREGAREFSEADEETAVALATTIGMRVEQERQCDHHVQRAEWLAASLRITSEIVASDAPEDALGDVAALAREVSGADAAWIRAGGSPEDPALVAISRGVGSAGGTDETLDELTRRVAEKGRSERAVPHRGDQLAVVVPLRSASGIYGSLTLTWAAERRADFETVPTDLPASFAEQAVLALEVARSREVRGRLQVLEERDRIAQDLHDVVLQDLFATSIELQRAARRTGDAQARRGFELAAGELQVTSRNLRRSIFGLGVGEPGTDLRAEISRLVQRASATLKVDVDVAVEGEPDSLDPEVSRDLVAVLAEALSNVARHARAGSVTVRVEVGDQVCLSVCDDGVGVPPDVQLSGLHNLRRRAERHGGHLSLHRSSECGTCLVWTTGAGAGRDPLPGRGAAPEDPDAG